MRIVDEAVQDGVGVSGIANDLMMFEQVRSSLPYCRWTMIFGFAFSASSASSDI